MIESPFATVRWRQRVTKGAGSRARGLVTAYTLLRMAEDRRRRVDELQPLPFVRAGVEFRDGVQTDRTTETKR